jgi:hypothetical protein
MLATLRRLRERPGASRGGVALAWAVATLVALGALSGAPGVSRDEATVLAAIEGGPAPEGGLGPLAAPLPGRAAAASHAIFSRVGLSHLRAARLATALLGAALSAALALLAWELGGPATALLAPALFWAAPRHLHAGLVATPDLALAALIVAAVVAYRRAQVDGDGRRRLRAALFAGVLFGGALAARTDAWVLLPALAVHAAVARLARVRRPAAGSPGATAQLPRLPPALVAMAVLGPLTLAAAWPALWSGGAAGIAAAFTPAAAAAWHHLGEPLRGPLPPSYPLVVTALALPATLLWAWAAGVGHALLRVLRALRGRAPAAVAPDEALLLLCAAAPLVAAAAGVAPAVAGVRPWLHAMPFLAVLGTRALLAAARVAWPGRAAPLAASLALLVVYPGIRAAAHAHPFGASAWNELAGGAPGAASLGMQRQDGGEAAAALLGAVNARARQGARIWWGSLPPAAVRSYSRDARLRPDLAVAEGPESADVAVVTLDGASRDHEYRAWSAFRTARPVAGVYLDEVPLGFVYARPGAWR